MPQMSNSHLKDAIAKNGTQQSNNILDDQKYFKTMFDILNSMTLTDNKLKVVGVASGLKSCSGAVAKVSNTTTTTKETMRGASMAMSTFKSSIDINKITNLTSVVAAVTYIDVKTIQKK